MNNIKSTFKSCGAYLPKKIVTNDDLAKVIDTNDEWIISRTGIKKRHIVIENETTSYLATKAALTAIERANIEVNEIDLIIVATTTPDQTFPSTATLVQSNIGNTKAACFDIQAVCAGFVYAISIADAMIKAGGIRNALIIGAETMSKILDWTDRNTCVLFGDGAGAVILSSSKDDNNYIISSKVYSDGSFSSILYADGGVSSTQKAGVIKMQGKEVFKNAVEKMSNSMKELLSISGTNINEVDHIIPHQANIRILEAVSEKLNVPAEKMVTTLDMHANTSAASIPLAINHIFENKKLKKGDLVLISAIGGGLVWGSSLFRW